MHFLELCPDAFAAFGLCVLWIPQLRSWILGLLGARTRTGLQQEHGGCQGSLNFFLYAQEGVDAWEGSAVYLGLGLCGNGHAIPWGLPKSWWLNYHKAL